jgi:hypothetical protein
LEALEEVYENEVASGRPRISEETVEFWRRTKTK